MATLVLLLGGAGLVLDARRCPLLMDEDSQKKFRNINCLSSENTDDFAVTPSSGLLEIMFETTRFDR